MHKKKQAREGERKKVTEIGRGKRKRERGGGERILKDLIYEVEKIQG